MDAIRVTTHLLWIYIFGLLCCTRIGSTAQRTTVLSRTRMTAVSLRPILIARTHTRIIFRTVSFARSPQVLTGTATGTSCPRPKPISGLLQYVTIDENAIVSDADDTYPAWTTINWVCRDPGRTRMVGSSESKCVAGVWSTPPPTCPTVKTQFGLMTVPPLPRTPLSDGSLAVYITPYTSSIDITCMVSAGGDPHLIAAAVSASHPRATQYRKSLGSSGQSVAGIRFTNPLAEDGGTFVCRDRSNTDMHLVEFVFDDQRYALSDPCPGDITVSTERNSTSAQVNWIAPSMVNDMGDITIVSTHQPSARFSMGSTRVVYNATDFYGTVEVCKFNVTVEDTEPPTIRGCPRNISVPNDPGKAMAQVSWGEPTATDNAGQVTNASKAGPGTYFGIGSIVMWYSFTDQSGNEARCEFSVTVIDVELPVVSCPPDILNNTEPGTAQAHARWRHPTASDNSGRVFTVITPGSGGLYYYGATAKEFVVQDDSGNVANCTFTVYIKDAEPPTLINCPRSTVRYIETYRDNTTTVRWHEPVADDNVGIAWPWLRSHVPGSKFAVGDHRVVYQVSDLEGNNASCSFDVTVVEARCPTERTVVHGVTYTWRSTITSTMTDSVERCPVNTKFGGHPLATRYCQFDNTDLGLWHQPRVRTCGPDLDPLNLRELSMVPVTRDNVKEVAMFVEAVVGNQTEFDPDDFMFLSDTLMNMADVESPSKQVSNSFVEIVDQVASLDLHSDARVVVGKEISEIVETLDRQIDESARRNKRLNIATANIAVRTTSVRPSDVTKGLTFAPVTSERAFNPRDKEMKDEGDDGTFAREGVLRTILTNDSNAPVQGHLRKDASIQLPSAVFEVAFNGSSVPVSFIVFRDDTLFHSAMLRRIHENDTLAMSMTMTSDTTWAPGGVDFDVAEDGTQPAWMSSPWKSPRGDAYSVFNRTRRVLGPVLSASVAGGLRIVDIDPPVVIEFTTERELNLTNIECVYWDFELEDGQGDWSGEGCQFAGRRTDGTITCHCNHLTNFAVLVDIHGQFEIDQVEKLVLDIITRIGCFLSIAGLSLTILTFLLFRSLRSNRSRQILVHLCCALLALYVVFVCGIAATRFKYACAAVAALLHYLVLVTVMWMGVEARHMYVMLVKVFKSERSRFVIKAAVIAWGMPLVTVSIAVGLSLDSYTNEKYCFLVPGHVMYYGLLLPIGVIMLHNFITFSLAIRNLLCSDLSGNSISKTKKEQVISRLQNAVCMSVLLGLTWSFGFLAVGQATFIFRLAFCVFNSFQGLAIFALFCARSKEVRSAYGALSFIECNIRSQSYRVKEKSYHGYNPNSSASASAWNGPCVVDWGDAPGLDAYMNANKARFSGTGTGTGSEESSRIPPYSISPPTVNANTIISNGNTKVANAR